MSKAEILTGPPDQTARDRIVEALDRSMLVEAGAGSGKTTSLVDRAVALVSTGTARVDEIAAVTFTRKAAAELRERFQEAVESALSDERTPAGACGRLDEALRGIDGAFIGTIHAFCARLLRERPIEAGLDPGFREMTGPDEIEMRREFWLRELERMRRGNDPLLQELEEVGLRSEGLYHSFGILGDNPDVEFPPGHGERPDAATVEAMRAELVRLLEEVRPYLPREEPEKGWDPLQQRIVNVRFSHDVFRWDDEAVFFEALGILMDGSKTAYQSRWGGGKEGKEVARRFQAAFEEYCADDGLARRALDRWWAWRYARAIRFGTSVAHAYRRERLETGRLTFQDLLMEAARLLRADADARKDLGRRFRYLLVDEFQDTDPVQAEVLFLLAAESPSERDWRAATPRTGALFVVGDPKQSIYRFRRADIAVYEEVRERFEELQRQGLGEIVSLTANFRSTRPIERFVNRRFEDLFPDRANRMQAAFAPLQIHDDDPDRGVVTWYEIDCEKENQLAVAESDAKLLASWIRGRIDRGERRPGDFLLLPYLRRFLSVYARALEARGVPVQVTGGDLLIDEEIHELRLVLEALVDPDNPILTAAALTGLFFGLDYEQLVQHRLAGGRFRFNREPPDASTEVGRGLGRLREWWLLARRSPADIAVSTIVDEVGLMPYAASGELGGARAGSLAFVVDTIRAVALEGRTSLRDAMSALDAVLELGEAEAPLEPGRKDVVRIMNLHKAKGMEASVVILAHPTGKTDWEPRKRIDRQGDRAEGWLQIARPINRWQFRVLAQPLDWRGYADNERSFEDAEAVRLLYVAATRAREELVVARFRPKDGESWWAPFYDHLEEECPRLEMTIEAPAPRPEVAVEPAVVQRRIEAVVVDRASRASPSYRAAPVSELAKGESRHLTGRGRGRDWGSAVHQALDAVGRGWSGETLARVCRAALLENGRPSAAGEPVELEELVALVEAVGRSDLLSRARASGQALHEVPFARPRRTGSDRGDEVPLEIVEGVIDLAFREENGWVIADYKTDELADPGELERRLAVYRAQVDLYADCWEELTGEPVKERILYLTAQARSETW
ncbi:MAG: UvrD-helicase domain-containing protein [Gemmatimonadota bacterium]